MSTPVPAPPSLVPAAFAAPVTHTGASVFLDRKANLCLWAVHVEHPDGSTQTLSGPGPQDPVNPSDRALAGMLTQALTQCGWDGQGVMATSGKEQLVLSRLGVTAGPFTPPVHACQWAEQAMLGHHGRLLGSLTLTTDASMSRAARARAGVGWVMDYQGTGAEPVYGMAVESVNRRHGTMWAELAAIRRGLGQVVARHPQLWRGMGTLTVRTDSMSAIRALRKAEQGLIESSRLRELCEEILRMLQGCTHQIQWVRGHDGDPANEWADRLAVMARRNLESGTDRQTERSMLSALRQDLRADLESASTPVAV